MALRLDIVAHSTGLTAGAMARTSKTMTIIMTTASAGGTRAS